MLSVGVVCKGECHYYYVQYIRANAPSVLLMWVEFTDKCECEAKTNTLLLKLCVKLSENNSKLHWIFF